ncbi:hypothetical protein [Arthrobacter sp. CP30]
MIEVVAPIVGLIARILLEVGFELLWLFDFPGRSKYREYLGTVPPGGKRLSKREWKAAGKPERPESADSAS